MLFNSLDYILFLGIAVAGFWLLARHAQLRIVFIFLASCLFYMAWHPAYIVLILGSTVVDYVVGLRIHATENEKARKRWLIVSLVSNLGLLGLFKYFNFASQATADVLHLFFGVTIEHPPYWKRQLKVEYRPVLAAKPQQSERRTMLNSQQFESFFA